MAEIVYVEEKTDALPQYGEVSIAFLVESELKVKLIDRGLGGVRLTEVPVESPYWVDYDANRGAGPIRWERRWNIENWGLISAFDREKRVGGAVIAFDTPGVDYLEGRNDITALWDLRVSPEYRGRGVGAALVRKCIEWSRNRGCKFMKVEL
jgi:GNAT superfamily N-acetyltransferase